MFVQTIYIDTGNLKAFGISNVMQRDLFSSSTEPC